MLTKNKFLTTFDAMGNQGQKQTVKKVMTVCDQEPMIQPDRDAVLAVVFESLDKMTPHAYFRELKSKFGLSSRAARTLLKQCIDDQQLCYQYHFGSTYIEKNFLRPVRMSNHFVLIPSGVESGSKNSDDIEIVIEQGISFGSGNHPTTRLCLQAIDYCFFERQLFADPKKRMGADIGTGSGVLAMAVCRAGAFECNAFEIDPVSVYEARKNIVYNHLEQHIEVLADSMPESKNTYDLICANLRFPTLKSLSGMIQSSLKENGIAILSGVREWEKQDLIEQFSNKGFEKAWQADDKKWSAVVLRKKKHIVQEICQPIL